MLNMQYRGLILIKCIFLVLIVMGTQASAQLTVTFPSKDGVTITADWYPVSENLPVILLCHQNRFSRGEYNETALRLNKFGFNCLAIDQRVGDEVNGVKNETAKAVKAKGKEITFIDAKQDIEAAIDYLFDKYKRNIILLGSSYSSSLVLVIATTNNKVSAVMAFSPGEYFEDKNYVATNTRTLNKPVFITSAKAESETVTDLLKDVNSRLKIQYVPAGDGDHGSKVLWSNAQGNQEYWIALMGFLDKIRNDL
jgi:dienelactone hydrolase